MFNRKWADKTRGEIRAYEHLASVLMVMYGTRFGFGENPVNYAHKVWLKNRRDIPVEETVIYQDLIEAEIKAIKRGKAHKSLLNGTASPVEVLDSMLRYDLIKKCK